MGKIFGVLLVLLGPIGAWALPSGPIQVVIRLKESVSMERLANSVTEPSSDHYRKFYSPEEIRAIAAPSNEEYQSVMSELKASGVQVVQESPTHLFITVKAERSRLLGLKVRLDSKIQSINGLGTSRKRFPHQRILDSTHGFSGYTAEQIHQLYNLNAIYNAGFTGKGQDIAIATYGGFYLQDIKDYYTQNNLAPGPQVDQVFFNGTPAMADDNGSETEGDAEFAGMIAPGANIHIFASSTNDSQGELSLLTAILDDNRSKVVNYSWGICESDLDPSHKADMDAVFARAVAQGINITVSSGDHGSDCMGNGGNSPEFPATNPHVVAVGGTSLSDNNGNVSESAWSGSGGGFSTLYSAPNYQSGFTGSSMRGYPDVAFNGDPATGEIAWLHYIHQPVGGDKFGDSVVGGTSVAAPQWAGFLALVGEARASGQSLGFLNPILYANRAAQLDLYDIISGSNGGYAARTGWDAVTGFGSLNAFEMFTFLRNY